MRTTSALSCLFCGDRQPGSDPAFTEVEREGHRFGWHPECWPDEAENLSDVVLRQTADGIRGRVREHVR